jgi:hypothetical protein
VIADDLVSVRRTGVRMQRIDSLVAPLAKAVFATGAIGVLLSATAAGVTGLGVLLRFSGFSLLAVLIASYVLRSKRQAAVQPASDQSPRAVEMAL